MKPVKKYKISRRLNVPVFEKCQTQTYALREKQKATKRPRRNVSEYGRQMLEKQKVRYLYSIGEKWLKRCVRESHAYHGPMRENFLINKLERRLDNIVYRIGLADTRRMARQMVSHGHIMVNEKRITIPSYIVKDTDIISIREGSLRTSLFFDLKEKMNTRPSVPWVEWRDGKNEGKISGTPAIDPDLLNLASVFEYYSR